MTDDTIRKLLAAAREARYTLADYKILNMGVGWEPSHPKMLAQLDEAIDEADALLSAPPAACGICGSPLPECRCAERAEPGVEDLPGFPWTDAPPAGDDTKAGQLESLLARARTEGLTHHLGWHHEWNAYAAQVGTEHTPSYREAVHTDPCTALRAALART